MSQRATPESGGVRNRYGRHSRWPCGCRRGEGRGVAHYTRCTTDRRADRQHRQIALTWRIAEMLAQLGAHGAHNDGLLRLRLLTPQAETGTQRGGVAGLGGFGGFLLEAGFVSLLEPALATAEKACRVSTAGAT